MKAGHGLDALIAEKVMGLDISGADFFLNESGGISHDIKPYSSDISAAWEVVEKLASLNHSISIVYGPIGAQVQIYNDFEPFNTDTAPHAICLAALKVTETP